jgi:DNA polymerase-3 subunit gamma/tau
VPRRTPPAGAPDTGASAAIAVAVAVEAEIEIEPDAEAEAEPQAEAASAEQRATLDFEGMRSLWPAVIETVKTENAMLAAALERARPLSLAADELRLAFAESAAFFKRKAEGNREAVTKAVAAVAGQSFRLAYELRADEEVGEDAAKEELSDEELIARVMAEFDAEELPPETQAAVDAGKESA